MEQRLANIETELVAIRTILEGGEASYPQARRSRRGQGEVKVGDPRVMAASFIRITLRDGPMRWAEIVARGRQFDHAPRTMRRVRDEVAVLDRRGGKYLWRLRQEDPWEEQNG